MKKSFSIVLASLLLVACSTKAPSATAPATSSPTSTTSSEVTSKQTSDISDKTVSTVFKSEVSFPYTYTDAAGRETTIDKQISRIAVDYLPLWESLTLLGIEPVAMNGSDNYLKTWDAFEGYTFDPIVDFGNGSEVNLELLASVEPDLIMTQVWDVNELDIGNYEKIAPTVVFDNSTKMDWRESLRQVGDLVGMPERSEEVIKQVDDVLKNAKEKFASQYQGKTVAQFSVMGEDRYFMTYRPDLYSDEGLGLKTPDGFTTNSESYDQVSMEAIAQMNPDYIFLNVFDGDEAIYDYMQSSSVWQSLEAVKNNHVYVIDGSGHATSALSTIYTVNFIIDKLTAE